VPFDFELDGPDLEMGMGRTISGEHEYSLQFILVVSNVDVYRYILVLDTSILVSSNMNPRVY
jgi:hypothetical protein